MIRTIGCSLLLGFSLAACGSEDAAHEFADAYAAKTCARFLQCQQPEGDPEEIAERATYTQAECERLVGGTFDVETETLLDLGRIRFDGDAARECLDSFDDLCAGGSLSECYDVFDGTVADGGSCTTWLECESERCSFNGANCGVCLDTARVGETCSVAIPCVSGSICINGVCAAFDGELVVEQAGLGESCDDTTTTEHVCAPGLYCDANARCAERLAVGFRCTGDSCVTDAICLLNADDEERCAPITVAQVVGADCGELTNGAGWTECDREARLYCDDGVCARLAGDGEIGSDCQWNQDCDEGLCGDTVCLATNLQEGSSCTFDEQCRSLVCSTNGLCTVNSCL